MTGADERTVPEADPRATVDDRTPRRTR